MPNQPKSQTETMDRTKTGTWYMITSPHTVEECMHALDKTAEMGHQNVSQWKWGCMSGDHTAYAMVQAESHDEAKRMVPDIVRSKARVAKLDQFTVDQIKNMHNM
jgi:hypothetical protein